jgi:c-di-GMP-binding flagellar brake protein YcgR
MGPTLDGRRAGINAAENPGKESASPNDISAVEEPNDPLNLTLGSVLQVQATVPENAPRYTVKLIGASPGGSLILTAPTIDGRVQIVREGQRFTVRALKGERVMGFVAQVLASAMRPYPHLHLEYPKEVEQIVVRNASRVSTEIPAAARSTEAPNEDSSFVVVSIVDLSETGAKIASDEALGEVGEVLHVKFELTISGEAEELGLIGEIKNVSERVDPDDGSTGHYAGVAFRSLSRFQQVLLHAWVTNHLLKSSLQSRVG